MRNLAAVLFFIWGSSSSWAHETVYLTTKVWEPYHYYHKDTGKLVGHSVSVLYCVFEKLNIPFEVEVLPWKRAQKKVEDGLADGFFSASWNKKRDLYATRSDDIAAQSWTWYYLKSNQMTPAHANFFKEARTAGTVGANITTWLQTKGYNVTAQAPSAENLIKMLLTNRFDAFMGNELVVDRELKDHPEKVKITKAVEREMPVGVYFSNVFLNKNANFLNKFNQRVRECRA